VETLEFADLAVKNSYECVFSLSQFPRACAVAASFQWYKAAKVTWTYEPCFNTFQSGAAATSKPYLYIVMNRTQNQNNLPALNQIQACGAKPVALVSTRKITYKPNWCSAGLLAVAPTPDPPSAQKQYLAQGLQAQYGWLASSGVVATIMNGNPAGSQAVFNPPLITAPFMNPTNQSLDGTNTTIAISTNGPVYNGHTTFIDQEYAGAQPNVIARLTCQVEWVFKGAVFNSPIGPQSAGVDAPVGASA